VHAEVERRAARQKGQPAGAGTAAGRTYLMVLVRPDGVSNYYRLQAAVRDLPVDFGYEFVEADWVLEFPDDDKTPATRPWMAAGRPRSRPTVRRSSGRRPAVAPAVRAEVLRAAGRPRGPAPGWSRSGPGRGRLRAGWRRSARWVFPGGMGRRALSRTPARARR